MFVQTDPLARHDVAGAVLASLRGAQMREEPFRYWRLANVLPDGGARAVTWIPKPPAALGGVSGRRELHNDQRHYFAGETLSAHPVARAVARAFQSPRIAAALAGLTGANLGGSFVRIELTLDTEGFWLEPHTDLGVKLLTLFIQLAEPCQRDLGTDLYWSAERWARREPFIWNAALLFRPSSTSWHGFQQRPISGVRRSLIVNYVTADWRSREQLAFSDRPVTTRSHN